MATSVAHRHRPSAAARRGFTLVEVMMSLAMLAVIMAAIVANMGSLHSGQQVADEASMANDILRHLAEKVQSAEFDELGIDDTWSEARFMTSAAGTAQPGMTPEQLLDWRIISYSSPLPNLEVFVEYYRGLNETDNGEHLSTYPGNSPGLMQWSDESVAEYQLRLPNRRMDDGSASDGQGNTMADYRLVDDIAIRNVGAAPIVVRVVLRWGENADATQRRRIELLTARTAESGSVQ
jgi:prepilin-type N-terminal cleavage/methylation domain-containing protein